MADLIRELHDAGLDVEDALEEGGDRWPFPAHTLVHAVERGYAELD